MSPCQWKKKIKVLIKTNTFFRMTDSWYLTLKQLWRNNSLTPDLSCTPPLRLKMIGVKHELHRRRRIPGSRCGMQIVRLHTGDPLPLYIVVRCLIIMYFYVLFLQIGAHIPLQSKEPKHNQTSAGVHAHTHTNTHTHTKQKTKTWVWVCVNICVCVRGSACVQVHGCRRGEGVEWDT